LNPIDIIHHAVDKGINLIDVGYAFKEERQEKLLRLLNTALKDGYREKVKITVTVPSGMIQQASDFNKNLEKQLLWLGDGEVDYCLLGGLNRYSWPRLRETDIIPSIEKAMSSGEVGKFGFSFHDYFQALRIIITEYDNWSLCSFQYSYMDADHHPGYGGIKFASDKGIAVMTTNPHLSGRLTAEIPGHVKEVWESAGKGYSRSEWALKWVWNHLEIASVVSNIHSMKQLRENILLANTAESGKLNISEQIFISNVRDAYRKLKQIPCTACRACMPCPQGINAPRIFEIYNDALMFNDFNTAQRIYREEDHRIEDCTKCGLCAKACGKQIPVPEWLETAGKKLAD
jgi:uncharacterized protein